MQEKFTDGKLDWYVIGFLESYTKYKQKYKWIIFKAPSNPGHSIILTLSGSKPEGLISSSSPISSPPQKQLQQQKSKQTRKKKKPHKKVLSQF